MPDLSQGSQAKVFLPAGRVLRVAAAGVATVKADGSALVNVTSNTQDFGPFATVIRHRVTAASGPCSHHIVSRDIREVVVAAAVPPDADGRPEGTIYLPSA